MLLGGAALSVYTGYLIAYCAEKTGGTCYEEIANKLYGTRGMRFTSFCNILCNLGFLISYTVLLKNLIPYTIGELVGHDLPHWIGNNDDGKLVWNTLFCFIILLPMSLPRDLSALRHTSLVNFFIAVFLVFTIFFLCFRETKDNCVYGEDECYDFSERFS